MKTKKNKTPKPPFKIEWTKDSGKVTWPDHPEWFVDGWIHPYNTVDDDEESLPPVFLRVYSGLPSRYIQKAYEAIRKNIGRVASDRRKYDALLVEIFKWAEAKKEAGNPPSKLDIRNRVQELKKAHPQEFQSLHLSSITERYRIKKGRENQPKEHRKHKVTPKTQIRWILSRAKQAKNDNPNWNKKTIAEYIERDCIDECDQNKNWNPKVKIENVLRRPKAYLKQGHP